MAGQSYFEWIQQPENKDVATDFNLLMKFTTQFRKSWMDVFSPDHILQGVKSSSDSLFVDIGGGIGTDASEFRHRYPHVHGKVFLQELPAVIDSALEHHGEVFSRVRSRDVETLSIGLTTQRDHRALNP